MPWWEGSGHSYLWPHSEKRRHAEGPARPPCSLGPWPPAPGYMSSEHHVFCKKRALLGWTGPAGPPRGGDSHLQAALIPQRADLRGPRDRTASKPCLWQKQSSYGGSPDGELPGAPSSGSTSRWSWRDLEARGIPATRSARGPVVGNPPTTPVGAGALRARAPGASSVSFCTATHGRRMSLRSTSSSQP